MILDYLRGRGIKVLPGFCQASCFLVSEELKSFEILTWNSCQHGDVQVIFKDAAKIQNGPQRSTSKFKVRNYSNYTTHFQWYGDVQVTFFRFYWNSKWLPQINFFVCAKRQKLMWEIIHILQSGNVQVNLLKFKMATKSWLFKYLWPQKL